MTNDNYRNVAYAAWNLSNEPDTDFTASVTLRDCAITINEMQTRIEALEQFERAYKEWSDKTEWVQETAQPRELGKHRADVLRERIAELEKDAALWIDMRDKVSKDWSTYRPMFDLLADAGCNEQITEIQYAIDTAMQKD